MPRATCPCLTSRYWPRTSRTGHHTVSARRRRRSSTSVSSSGRACSSSKKYGSCLRRHCWCRCCRCPLRYRQLPRIKRKNGGGGRRQRIRGRAQAITSTIISSASYPRCISRHYIQFQGPTLQNNHGNYGKNSFCPGAENEGLLPARYFGGLCL